MKRVLALFLCLSVVLLASGEKVKYQSPVNYRISLAGNFGEPRPNHFHGGADIKTDRVEGKPIFSIGDGYISHVSIGIGGFGNAYHDGLRLRWCGISSNLDDGRIDSGSVVGLPCDDIRQYIPGSIRIIHGVSISVGGAGGGDGHIRTAHREASLIDIQSGQVPGTDRVSRSGIGVTDLHLTSEMMLFFGYDGPANRIPDEVQVGTVVICSVIIPWIICYVYALYTVGCRITFD